MTVSPNHVTFMEFHVFVKNYESVKEILFNVFASIRTNNPRVSISQVEGIGYAVTYIHPIAFAFAVRSRHPMTRGSRSEKCTLEQKVCPEETFS